MHSVMILGAGGFGIALAQMLNSTGNQVTLWEYLPTVAEQLKITRKNEKLLPGIVLPEQIQVTNDIGETKGKDVVIFAVPSAAVRQTAMSVKEYLNPKALVISVSKGIEDKTFMTMSAIVEQVCGIEDVVALSGPSHAEEVARGVPTTLVAAARIKENAEATQDIMMNPTLRVYINDDKVGVELGGALKNCIALACGAIDGMKFGDNTKAALMTRGLAEMARLGVAMGGRKETFAGLAGVGDLIVTCTSCHSRNHEAGLYMGQGLSPKEAIAKVGKTVEGYGAVESAFHLSQKMGVDMPIISHMYQVLYGDMTGKEALQQLMQRPKKSESEEVWFD